MLFLLAKKEVAPLEPGEMDYDVATNRLLLWSKMQRLMIVMLR